MHPQVLAQAKNHPRIFARIEAAFVKAYPNEKLGEFFKAIKDCAKK